MERVFENSDKTAYLEKGVFSILTRQCYMQIIVKHC